MKVQVNLRSLSTSQGIIKNGEVADHQKKKLKRL